MIERKLELNVAYLYSYTLDMLRQSVDIGKASEFNPYGLIRSLIEQFKSFSKIDLCFLLLFGTTCLSRYMSSDIVTDK